MKTMFEEKLENGFHFTHFYQFGKTFIQIPGQLENRSGNGKSRGLCSARICRTIFQRKRARFTPRSGRFTLLIILALFNNFAERTDDTDEIISRPFFSRISFLLGDPSTRVQGKFARCVSSNWYWSANG